MLNVWVYAPNFVNLPVAYVCHLQQPGHLKVWINQMASIGHEQSTHHLDQGDDSNYSSPVRVSGSHCYSLGHGWVLWYPWYRDGWSVTQSQYVHSRDEKWWIHAKQASVLDSSSILLNPLLMKHRIFLYGIYKYMWVSVLRHSRHPISA